MTPELRAKIAISRSRDYFDIMRTTIFTLLGVGAVIHFGADAYSAPLLMLAITASAYGILAGGVALDDIDALRGDMDEAMAGSGYGAAVKARNVPMLKMISAGLIGLTGLAEVLAILI